VGAPSFNEVLLEQLDLLEPSVGRSAPVAGPSLWARVNVTLRRSELSAQLPRPAATRPAPTMPPPARPAPSPNCLRLLGLRLPCTEADVRRAFRQQALDAHPDRLGGTHGAFVALQQAYEDALCLLAA